MQCNLYPAGAKNIQCRVNLIQESAYSEEVKSNYTGSLVTRIKSLTNGLNGQIFTANEVDNTELFDGKVVVDISRLGSVEKASDTVQFKYCTEQSRKGIEQNPELAKQFTSRQLEQIKNGEPGISGLTWHHNEKPGEI